MTPNVRKLPVEVSFGLNWCNIVDAFQTSAIAAITDYKLKRLVELFGLSGDLLNT